MEVYTLHELILGHSIELIAPRMCVHSEIIKKHVHQLYAKCNNLFKNNNSIQGRSFGSNIDFTHRK